MNLLDKCTNNEINLMKEAGIIVENREYTNEDLKKVEHNIVEYIMNHSSKDIQNLQSKYQSIFRTIDVK